MVKDRSSLSRKAVIGIDIMGSDNDPAQLLSALRFPAIKGISFLAIGAASCQAESPLPFHIADEWIGMEENPLTALRKKKSSMAVGLRLLKEGKLDAFVSAGNTGALVAISRIVLGVIPPLRRAALLALIPTKKHPIAVLDVGANVSVKAKDLVHFARIATAYLQSRGIAKPKVGLLNIGTEPIKGTSENRLAYHALQTYPNPPFQFVGNIEGKSVFDGEVDALITDGFTGNVLLKTSEGIASLLLDRLFGKFPQMTSALEDLKRHLHYANYPGALLAGLKKVVIKCHGYSSSEAIVHAVLGAVGLIQESFIPHFQKKLKLGS